MSVTLVGGPADGVEVETPRGLEAQVAVLDGPFMEEWSAWLSEYGAAHALAQAFDRPWDGPPEPSSPTAHYRWVTGSDGEITMGVYQRTER